MVLIAPFRGLRYRSTDPSYLSKVLAPPYDVISPTQRDVMWDQSPYNMVRLILNRDADPYSSAASYIKQWQDESVLVPDERPSYYVHFQTYTHPDTGERLTRKGVLVRIKAEPFSVSGVRAHEKTLAGPKADRLKLFEATQSNFSPVFGLMPDADEQLLHWMQGIASAGAPEWDFEFDGSRHQLWCVSDIEKVAQLTKLCGARHALIADGHHRYETGVAYAQAHRDREEAQYNLMTLVPMSDPGLLVLPTHRLLQGFTPTQWERALAKVSPYFTRTTLTDLKALEQALQHQIPLSIPAFGVLIKQGKEIELWQLKPGVSIGAITGLKVPTAYDVLDLSWLHQLVFEFGLGMTADDQSNQKFLRYFKHSDEALKALEGDGNVLFYMRAVGLSVIDNLAAEGLVMPQKSTYFYPKLPSGLVIHHHPTQVKVLI